MKGFTKNEKRMLEEFVCSAKKSGEPLTGAFKKCALKTGRAGGSVRNYYYRVVAKQNSGLYPVRSAVKFTRREEVELLRAILAARVKFGSTRSAILHLANGNKKLALRYQNKFSSLLNKQRAMVMREMLIQKQKSGECFNPYRARALREKAAKARARLTAAL